jgi:DNA-binding NtrC family response regulator
MDIRMTVMPSGRKKMNETQLDQIAGDIFIVDDDMPSLQTLSNMLVEQGYEVRGAQNGTAALQLVEKDPPDLILLDVRMPEMDGYEVCRQLKANEKFRDIPVLFLIALDEMEDKAKGLEAGAVDFITKPFQAEEVLARVDTHVALSRLRKELKLHVEERSPELKESEEHFRFQELISRISTKFIGLSGVEFEQAIQDTLGEIGRYFDVDSVRLYRLSLQGDVLKFRLNWRSDNLAPPEEMPEIHKMIYPNLAAHYSKGDSILFGSIEECPQLPELLKILKFFGTKAGLGVPLEIDDSGVDVFAMDKVQTEHVWPEDIIEHSKAIGKVILSAMRRREAEVEVQDSYDEIKQLKDRLEQENIYLRKEIEINYRHDEIVGESDAIKGVLSQAEKVAGQDASVLILGDTGTGKELLAHAIHNISRRKSRAMIKVNCAALPSTLIESELFGREKGAFTGALSKQIGRFEAADGSTIFLDEIGDLPLDLQAKLLRVLHEGEFERLGSTKTVSVDVRVIAATNHDLEQAMREGRFRQDLFYRLNVFPITVPPLRERREDIPLLVWAFVKEIGEGMGRSIEKIPKKSMDMLQEYPWPGNVRELRNVIERAMILSIRSTLIIDRLESKDPTLVPNRTLEEIERNHIADVLESVQWRVYGKNGAAEILGLKPSTLQHRMKKLGIEKPR